MIRRKQEILPLRSGVARGGFDSASPAVIQASPISLTGRGSSGPEHNVQYVAPLSVQETSKPRKKKDGDYVISRKTKVEKKDNEGPIDDNGNINWEYLEENRKRKPCKRLLKQLNKK